MQSRLSPPAGYPRITAYLRYQDTGAMMEWLADAFGLVERSRMAGPDGAVQHAEMELEDSPIMLGSPGGDYRNPRHVGHATSSLYVYIDDVDAHCERARSSGAEIIEEPADQPYGDRRYGVRDPEGQEWYFASRRAADSPGVGGSAS
ncbi:MAG: VOC family protein [Gemmatimonadota bacterium]